DVPQLRRPGSSPIAGIRVRSPEVPSTERTTVGHSAPKPEDADHAFAERVTIEGPELGLREQALLRTRDTQSTEPSALEPTATAEQPPARRVSTPAQGQQASTATDATRAPRAVSRTPTEGVSSGPAASVPLPAVDRVPEPENPTEKDVEVVAPPNRWLMITF